MAQENVKQFERARSTTDLGELGDPERWGDSVTLVFTFPANFTGDIILTSRQLVRVQVPQLIARKWGLVATWTFSPGDPTLTLSSILVDAVIGVGQASYGTPLQAFPVSNVQTPYSLAATAGGGATDLGEVVAAAINARMRVKVHGAATPGVVVAKVLVGLAASPRAL
jgi:hypothetical protein